MHAFRFQVSIYKTKSITQNAEKSKNRDCRQKYCILRPKKHMMARSFTIGFFTWGPRIVWPSIADSFSLVVWGHRIRGRFLMELSIYMPASNLAFRPIWDSPRPMFNYKCFCNKIFIFLWPVVENKLFFDKNVCTIVLEYSKSSYSLLLLYRKN